MAIDQHGDEVLHSIYGRKLGVDKSGFVVGSAGVRSPHEAVTAASTLTAYGVSALSGTTATFTIQAPPAVGAVKEIVNNSSLSTAAMTIVRSTAAGACDFLANTSGTTALTAVAIALIQRGSGVTLRAISTALWAPTSYIGSSLYYTQSVTS